MEQIKSNQIKDMLASIAKRMEENREFLCSLDQQMGDGDLGITMSKGWKAAADTAREIEEQDIGKLLMKCSLKMSSTVPSTMGTLMASGLLEGGKRVSGKEYMGTTELADFLLGFSDGIKKRGKCNSGDRTVLDSMMPAAEVAGQNKNGSLENQIEEVVKAARAGMEATKNMIPKFGKAAVFTQKAQGVIDQGAAAGVLVLEGLCNYILAGVDKEEV